MENISNFMTPMHKKLIKDTKVDVMI